MNILISQSQGETFAALSLQLPLPNTHIHTHTKLNLLPSAFADCCSSLLYSSGSTFVCMFLSVYWRRQCARFTQGERGMEWTWIITILAFVSVSTDVNCCMGLCLCVGRWSFHPSASLLTSPRVHLCSGPGLCPQPAMWNWVVGGEEEQHREFKTLRSCCNWR